MSKSEPVSAGRLKGTALFPLNGVHLEQEGLEFLFCRFFDVRDAHLDRVIAESKTVRDRVGIIILIAEMPEKRQRRFSGLRRIAGCDQVMMPFYILVFFLDDFYPVITHKSSSFMNSEDAAFCPFVSEVRRTYHESNFVAIQNY
jgi:hypothetical protein